ncbi:MAG TPA: metallophosphoesterase family protein [Bradyrhizobium sp.]|nr:metallophosphoesterase family protein [Bradyrhizobium sp.]
MLFALLSDIHANREALTACLADAARAGAERYVFLGDLVGYCADPGWVVDRAAEMVEAGALAVLGNHDAAILNPTDSMNEAASVALEWTRTRLNPAQRSFLAQLPLTAEDGDRLYVHASASAPDSWIYIFSPREAFQSFRATHHRLTFCGHTHVPALFNESAVSQPHQHIPNDDQPIPLLGQRRWLAVLGAVGQPRDNNPAACYGLFDDVRNRLTYVRVRYDAELTARKIRAAGLPEFLATRLTLGV